MANSVNRIPSNSLAHFTPEFVFDNFILKRGKFLEVDLPEGITKIKTNSARYILFKQKGYKCVKCGMIGSIVKVTITEFGQVNVGHFNFYGVKNGEMVLLTKDHIIPVSKGGKNSLENYQTMCSICNQEKRDLI